jgi:hypothetical protein
MEASPAKTVLRVVAISGSLRRASTNNGLIRAGEYNSHHLWFVITLSELN